MGCHERCPSACPTSGNLLHGHPLSKSCEARGRVSIENKYKAVSPAPLCASQSGYCRKGKSKQEGAPDSEPVQLPLSRDSSALPTVFPRKTKLLKEIWVRR